MYMCSNLNIWDSRRGRIVDESGYERDRQNAFGACIQYSRRNGTSNYPQLLRFFCNYNFSNQSVGGRVVLERKRDREGERNLVFVI